MEELPDPSEPNSGIVFKIIRLKNFRCMTCRQVFRSEYGVKKHLENNHGYVDPPAILYETFVSFKREKVLKKPSLESETVEPFHGIKYPLNSSSETMKTQEKPVIKFVTPSIENKKESQNPDLVEKKVEKTQGPKRKRKDENPKEKKNPKTNYCKSLNNVFTSGNIQMRSLNLWNKKEKRVSPPCQNNTQETRHPENSLSQPNLCEDEFDKSHNTVADYVSAQTPNIIPQSQSVIPQPENMIPQPENMIPQPENMIPQSENMIPQSENMIPQSENMIPQSENMIPQSENMIPQSQKSAQSKASSPLFRVSKKTKSQNSFHQPQNSFELPQTIHTKQSDNKNKLNKMRVERKKKTCNDPECRLSGPCSEEDCGICQFCQNRNLKNKCVRRKCPNLNIRVVKGAEDEILNGEEHDDTESNEDDNALNSAPIETDQVLEVSDEYKFIGEIVEEVVNALPEKNVEQVISKKKEKRYPCDKCGKLFSQFATSKKHCVVKRSEDLGAVCPICGKKLEKKRNLKRHISNVHDPTKSYKPQNTSAPAPIKCPECGKEYAAKNKLTEHRQRKHGLARKDGKLFNCTECDFAHYSMSRVKAHVTVTHSTQGTNVFSCSICNIIYKSASGLRKHKRSVHDNVASSFPSLPPAYVVANKSKPPPSENTQSQVFLDANVVAKKSKPPSSVNTQSQVFSDANKKYVNASHQVGNLSQTTSSLSTAQENPYPRISDIVEADMSIINSMGSDSDVGSFPKADFQFQMDTNYIESELSYHQL